MKQLIVCLVFILLSLIVLVAESSSTCRCSCGDNHDEEFWKKKTEEKAKPTLKQCAFKNLQDDRDNGQIMTCDFQKAHASSALRVTYQGDIRMLSCSNNKCCRRWYITINGKECSSPAPIDASFYAGGGGSLNLHRPATLDGLCSNIPKGRITVGLSVGNCKYSQQSYSGDAYTCWNSSCRLIIEEINALQ
ncbi:collagen triple helix repeat-containing protein 1-like [Dendronephthya gigantea]|uniref:collagen triple helix repeat-containing protein 1-like n=1 Tax=Dendronephthya gigantea TaxID=151771 RepID=UPI00106963F7|nr:collagen triple helix repeat-containing protein 1-like [Dendronephthya gigantea]